MKLMPVKNLFCVTAARGIFRITGFVIQCYLLKLKKLCEKKFLTSFTGRYIIISQILLQFELVLRNNVKSLFINAQVMNNIA